MTKRVLSIVLTLIVMMSIFSVASVKNVSAANEYTTSNGIKYELESGTGFSTARITGYTGSAKNLNIPNKVDYSVWVRGIWDGAFSGCTSLRSVTIASDGASFIGDNAFKGCSNLESITMPDDIVQIGKGAFEGCYNLTDVVLSKNLWTIENNVFKNCTSLTEITIPNRVCKIGDSAFYNCRNLTNIIIPKEVETIGKNAFENCTYLERITLPDGLKTIESGLFWNCTNLEEVVLPNSITSIGEGVFANCTSLTEITIPIGVTSIAEGAFSGCTNLNKVYYNGSQAQWDAIWIGNKNDALMNVKVYMLKEFFEYGGFEYQYKLLSNGSMAIGITGCYSEEQDLVIPSEIEGLPVIEISESAFEYNNSFKSITIPHSVMVVNGGTFSKCDGLSSIKVDEKNTVFDSRDNCNAIIETKTNELVAGCSATVIPNSVVTIGKNAFRNNKALQHVTIPKSITMIESGAFSGCSNLSDVYYDGAWAKWKRIEVENDNSALTNAYMHFVEENTTDMLLSIWDIDVSDGGYPKLEDYNTIVVEVPNHYDLDILYVDATHPTSGALTAKPGILLKEADQDLYKKTMLYVAYIPKDYNKITITDGGSGTTNEVVVPDSRGFSLVKESASNEKASWKLEPLSTVKFYNISKDSVIEGRGYTAEDLGQNEIKLTVSDKPGVKFDSVNGTAIGYIGDSDGNNTVNVKDATNIQKYVADLVTFTEKAVILGDVDDSGVVNVRDATTIQKYVAGMNVTAKIKHLVYEEGEHKHCYKETIVAPKCILTGYTSLSCICGAEKVLNYVPATGEHTYTKKVIKPTCTQDGYTLTECKYCDKSDKSDHTKATGHNYEFVRIEKEGTCISGRQDLEKCTACGNEHYNITPAPGHNYTTAVTKPTCDKQGYTTYTCTRCNESYKDNYTAATGHSYTTVVTKPTCDKQGYTTYTCTRCNESYKDNYTAATGHKYNSKNVCTVCNSKQPENLAAFDNLAAYIKKHGTYDYRSTAVYDMYLPMYYNNMQVRLTYITESQSFLGEPRPAYIFVMLIDGSGGENFNTSMCWYRGDTNVEYEFTDVRRSVFVEGTFKMSDFKSGGKLTGVVTGNVYSTQKSTYVTMARDSINLCLGQINLYFVSTGSSAGFSLKKLGFSNY